MKRVRAILFLAYSQSILFFRIFNVKRIDKKFWVRRISRIIKTNESNFGLLMYSKDKIVAEYSCVWLVSICL